MNCSSIAAIVGAVITVVVTIAAMMLGVLGYLACKDVKTMKNDLEEIKVANNISNNRLEFKLAAQTGDVSFLNSTTEDLKQHYSNLLSNMDVLNRSIDYASVASVQQIRAELNTVMNRQTDILKKLDVLSHLNDTEDHLKLREEMSALSSIMTNLTQNVTDLEKKIETTRRDRQNVAKWQEMYQNNLSMVVNRVSLLERKDSNKSNKATSLEYITFYISIFAVILSLV